MKKKILKIKLFKEFLNYFWLRPENAIIFTLKSCAIHKLRKKKIRSSLDIACGDGVFSFITNFGTFKISEDMYLETNLNKKDIYDEKILKEKNTLKIFQNLSLIMVLTGKKIYF